MQTTMFDPPEARPTRTEMLRVFETKDAAYDGVFYVAVKTTGIFCRPSCPSHPLPANLEFFRTVKDCLSAGYRPCKRCRPEEAGGTPPGWVIELMARVRSRPEERLLAEDLRRMGISPERARRWFREHQGMSFAAWCRGHRLAGAFARLRDGVSLDDATFDSGFESHSGFRDAFARVFGTPPGRSRTSGERVVVAMIESPLGPLLAGTGDAGVCLLEYTERRRLEHQIEAMRCRLGGAVIPGEHPLLDRLRDELAGYFQGHRREFSLPLLTGGTPFQERVWEALRGLAYGETISYGGLARRLGQPTASRAVAQANHQNRISILIPCHRVVGQDGSLTGYGGGLWRKRLLLELERTGNAL